MNFHRATLETCVNAEGAVVVIDVIRAFTSAAYAFGAGAAVITLVSTIDEAFALRQQNPDALIMGEDGGKPIPGFDFSNSPTHYLDIDLSGHSLIQRTTHGTQGVVRSVRADTLLTASFPCARATAARLRALQPQQVTFVITGWEGDGLWGDEDMACADYLEALLRGLDPDPAPYLIGCGIRRPACSSPTRRSRTFRRMTCPFAWRWTASTSPCRSSAKTDCCT